MNNIDYWKKREEAKVSKQFEKADLLEKELKEQYEIALEEINKKITYFYEKYAKDNDMTYKEATMFLNGKEYSRWRKTLEGYINDIEYSEDELLQLELNTLAMKSRVRRIEALKTDVSIELHKLYKKQNETVTGVLTDIAKGTYYETIYQVQVFEGIGHAFAKLNKNTIETILSHPWSGANFSDRIWKQKEKLTDTIKQELTQKFIQGKSVRDTAKAIANKMDVSYKNACTLVQTESAYIAGESTARGYEATGVEKYQILATLDSRTSSICREQDGKVYDLRDRTIGVNYPPFHVRCRTTTVPYFEDEEDTGKRAAKKPKGKTYYVPANMTYEEWYSEHVEDNGNGDMIKEKDFKYPEIKTIEDAKKVLINKVGFTEVEDSFIENVDPELIIKNTRQLQKLEDKFGAIHNSEATISSGNRFSKDTIAYVHREQVNPTRQNLSLNADYYSNFKKMVDNEKGLVQVGYSMPKALTDEELSISSVTHEYGHILQNVLVKNEMELKGWSADKPNKFLDLKKKTTKSVFKWYDNIDTKTRKQHYSEIIDIAKNNNPKFDFNANISRYGKTNYEEFFAEVFANSQLSKPNELGLSMKKWLKSKGIEK